MKTRFFTLLIAFLSIAAYAQKSSGTMKYKLNKQKAIYNALMADKNVQKSLAQIESKKTQRELITDLSVFLSLNESDQKYVAKDVYKYMGKHDLGLGDAGFGPKPPNYQSQGWFSDVTTAIGAILGIEGGPGGVAVGAAVGKAVGSVAEEVYEAYTDNNDGGKDGVVPKPDGTGDGEGNGSGFPYRG